MGTVRGDLLRRMRCGRKVTTIRRSTVTTIDEERDEQNGEMHLQATQQIAHTGGWQLTCHHLLESACQVPNERSSKQAGVQMSQWRKGGCYGATRGA